MKKSRQLDDDGDIEDNIDEEDSEISEEEKESSGNEESKGKVQVLEREITLSLLNDKLNYIISKLPK